MQIGVLGTGVVGRTLGSKLVELGHDVRMGSRQSGNETAAAWVESAGARASEGSFANASTFGQLVINATAGAASLDALHNAGAENLDGKVLMDVSNAIDRNTGFPPQLSVCNNDSLAEQIQRAFPSARVVKTLNTVNAAVMVNPRALGGRHVVFLSGEDGGAKHQVGELLGSFGWSDDEIIDLGGIETARGTEMYLPLWLRLMVKLGGAAFNIGIVRKGA